MKHSFLILCIFGTIFLTGCSKDDEPSPDPDYIQPHAETNRTVLAYFVGDMSLWNCLEEDVNHMEEGWNNDIDGTLLVYLDNSHHLTQFGQPILLEITHDESDMIVSKVVKAYDDQDAGDPKVMQKVLNDAITLYPAKSHGLIIGAHGNGWLPELKHDGETRAISGPDRYESTLEICELADILPVKYDFIMFHACNMANIETVYQLRNKCNYVVASALPLPGYGYPYEKIVPYFYTKPYSDLYKVAYQSVLDYANIDSNLFSGFTVSVIKTSELEKFASATSKLLDDLNMGYYDMYSFLTDNGILIDYYEDLLYDLSGLYYLSNNDELKEAYYDAIKKAVIQCYFVPGYMEDKENAELMCRIDKYGSGMSFYLPHLADDFILNQINTAFKNKYDWSKASGFDKDRI